MARKKTTNFMGYNALEMDILYTMAKYPKVRNVDLLKKYKIGPKKLGRHCQKLYEDKMFDRCNHYVSSAFYDNFIISFVGINIDDASMCDEICQQLCKFPEVFEVYPVMGQYDILIKMVSASPKGLYATLSSRIQQVPGIVKTETFMCGPNAMFGDLRGNWKDYYIEGLKEARLAVDIDEDEYLEELSDDDK